MLDVHVTDIDAASYVSWSVSAVLSCNEEKKCKYLSAAKLRHVSFAPFVVSVDGVFRHEVLMLVQYLADRLSSRWGKSYGYMLASKIE